MKIRLMLFMAIMATTAGVDLNTRSPINADKKTTPSTSPSVATKSTRNGKSTVKSSSTRSSSFTITKTHPSASTSTGKITTSTGKFNTTRPTVAPVTTTKSTSTTPKATTATPKSTPSKVPTTPTVPQTSTPQPSTHHPNTTTTTTTTTPKPLPSQTCAQALLTLFDFEDGKASLNLKQAWPLIAGSGGTLNSMGDYGVCVAEREPWLVQYQYCVFDAEGHAVTTGLCLPKACHPDKLSIENITQELQHLAQIVNSSTVKKSLEEVIGTLEALSDAAVYCGKHSQLPLDFGAVVMIIIIVILAGLAGTQWYLEHRAKVALTEEERSFLQYENMDEPVAINTDGSRAIRSQRNRRQGSLAFVLKCWSLKDNLKELLSSNPKRTLRSLDGLRAISMFIIILGHTINFQLPGFVGFDNLTVIPKELQTWTMQFVAAASFAVDTFYFLSGLLTAYVLIRKINKSGRSPPISLSVVLRYLRLTPLLAFLVGLYAALFKYFGKGPLWFRFVDEIDHCKTSWWSNLLYINNFYPVNYKEQCIPWAWYLANDFQFFILGMLILWLYNKTKTGAYIASFVMTMCGLVATTVLAVHYNIQITNKQATSQNYLYDKPYTRATPYGLGLLTAFFVSSHMDQLKAMSNGLGHVLTLLSLAVISFVVYVVANFNWDAKHPNWNADEQLAYVGSCRFFYSIALAVLVMMCSSGHGSVANWVLTLPIWEPFAKLTFGAYLIHPMLIRMVYYQRTQLFHFEPVEASALYLGFLTAAYVLGVVLFLLVEQPAANLTKALTGGRRK
eukprot:TRINITY_DN11804_c1_g1_i1.p1 TRINITY_DN11804_c1_g1~~TRINITY_DN11804_c1_g1_i1.p1  ORF type:complete len:787 (+),score=220.84 TRINITY_DN11804_c1_g1_i1:113-2473(+)